MKTSLPFFFLLAAAVPAPAENDAPPADEPDAESASALPSDALAELKKRADSGDSGAQTELGMRHLYGVGVPENAAEAERLLSLAAAQGSAEASRLLADLEKSAPEKQ